MIPKYLKQSPQDFGDLLTWFLMSSVTSRRFLNYLSQKIIFHDLVGFEGSNDLVE